MERYIMLFRYRFMLTVEISFLLYGQWKALVVFGIICSSEALSWSLEIENQID